MISAMVGFLFLLSLPTLLIIKLSSIRSKSNNLDKKRGRRSLNANGKSQSSKKPYTCAFFHPNCSAGGGGERTLWAAVNSIKLRFPDVKLVIYTNGAKKLSFTEIKSKVMKDFNLVIPDGIEFVPLNLVFFGESPTYPRLTLLGQIIGSVIVGLEAMIKFKPDLLIDTSGFPFIYPIVKLLFKCKLVAYVHYPFISKDMLNKLNSKSYNNPDLIAKFPILRSVKTFYYKSLINIYGFAGKCCDLAMTNSTWTNDHITNLWNTKNKQITTANSNTNLCIKSVKTEIVYPPCDLTSFSSLKLERPEVSSSAAAENEKIKILSLSQFRPEKNHRLQLEIAAQVLKKVPNAQFIFVGGCRDKCDEARVEELKKYSNELGIMSSSVLFLLNLPFQNLLSQLQQAHIGLHTMTEEHFGIGIAELMAAGLIIIAHNSGGPRADIVKNEKTGFLCSSASEYTQTILKIISMTPLERIQISTQARKDVTARFSEEIFAKKFSDSIQLIKGM